MNNKTKIIALLTSLIFIITGCSVENDPPVIDTADVTSDITEETEETANVDVTAVPEETTYASETAAETTEAEETTDEAPEETTAQNTSEIDTPPTAEDTEAPTVTQAPVTTTSAAPVTQPAEPSPATVLTPTASGKLTESNSLATIDYSNTSDGYVMAKYTGTVSKIKVQITGPNGVTQTYNLNSGGSYESYPLTGSSGSYTIMVLENVGGTSYAIANSVTFSVSLSNPLAPYLRPSNYVPYSLGDSAVTKASQLCGGTSSSLEKVDRVYTWLVDNVSYDYTLASSNIAGGYVADTEKVINSKIGICLDYAGTMAAMLRSQSVPTQVVVGYSGGTYHAWVNVYITDVGWVYGVIYFDGSGWQRMDPTYAASSNSNSSIMQYIGNGSNYQPQYYY